MIDQESINKLAKVIAEGTASEETQGLVLKTVSTQMSVTLLSSMNEMNNSFNRLNTILNSLIDRYVEQTETALVAGSINRVDLLDDIQQIQSKQLQYIDLYRKTIQAPKGLFADSIMSEDEKKVVRLFKSFKSEEEKRKFLQLCDKFLNGEIDE